jgi:hypothetical protein
VVYRDSLICLNDLQVTEQGEVSQPGGGLVRYCQEGHRLLQFHQVELLYPG